MDVKSNKIIIKENILEIAKTISKEYKERFGYENEISPIKMQKTLYFLFALWAKDVNKKESEFDELSEFRKEYKNTYLFSGEFNAWEYGPVVPEVYKNKNEYLNINDQVRLFKNYDEIQNNYSIRSYIEDKLDRIFNTNDFSLVSISHDDECWIKAKEKGYNTEIPLKEIYYEYSIKN